MLTNSQPTKVLICDDSAILRRLTRQALSSDANMKVVAEAANGKEALDAIAKTQPDAVLLDVEMPIMDGVDTLRQIRRRFGDLPVIMFSSITTGSQSEATIDALAAGANDYVAKPSSVGSLETALKSVGEDLIRKIKAFTRKKAPARINIANKSASVAANNLPIPKSVKIDVVGVGSSTGGPKALATVLEKLTTKFNVPILITQHMPATFIAPLAARLSNVAKHDVRAAEHDQELVPGRIIIAPGDHHLKLVRKQGKIFTAFDDGPPVHSCKPAVDPMLESLAEHYGKHCLGVILTGMGKDGCDGCRAVKQAGGIVFAQDEATSVVYGMPREVATAGLANRILPVDQIGGEISQLISASPIKLVGVAATSNT